jgi:hypothetical protein
MSMPPILTREEFSQHLSAIFAEPGMDLYAQLNAMRDWVNAQYQPEFDLYLEDTWNERTEGETHIERSRKTLNETEPLGYDAYLNHKDGQGVWHLDDYTHSVRLFQDPGELYDFIAVNTAL